MNQLIGYVSWLRTSSCDHLAVARFKDRCPLMCAVSIYKESSPLLAILLITRHFPSRLLLLSWRQLFCRFKIAQVRRVSGQSLNRAVMAYRVGDRIISRNGPLIFSLVWQTLSNSAGQTKLCRAFNYPNLISHLGLFEIALRSRSQI